MRGWNKSLFPNFFRLKIKSKQDKIGIITCMDLIYRAYKSLINNNETLFNSVERLKLEKHKVVF
jgi:hypothetical protein